MTLPTEEFVQGLHEQGVTHLCAVPCSFAKNLINAAINHPVLEYLPCASEAIAASVAAGLHMAGQEPLVVIQSSGLTNMGSCLTSLLKPYGVHVPILTSWRSYAEGDSEIQHQHLAHALPDLIQAYGYEYQVLDTDNVATALEQISLMSSTHTIGVLQKGSFSPVELLPEHQLQLDDLPPRSAFLQNLNQQFQDSDILFIGTTGNAAREMYAYMPDTHNFYMAGNMGGALSLGYGAAKAGKKVVVCGGDAEFVMHMGGLTTAGRDAAEINLVYVLFDNQCNKSTGGQNTYQQHVDYIGIARAAGFACSPEPIDDVALMSRLLDKNIKEGGLHFMHIRCGLDPETPRPPVDVIRKNTL